jgi:hypothetical protein
MEKVCCGCRHAPELTECQGTYKWTLKMVDQNNEPVMCVSVKIDMEAAPGTK